MARKSRDGDTFVFAQYERIKAIKSLAQSDLLPDLTNVDFAVLTLLATHTDANGEHACPSADTLAAEMRVHRMTVVKSLQRLEKNGVIRWTGWSRYRTKSYNITLPTSAEDFAKLIANDFKGSPNAPDDDQMITNASCHMVTSASSDDAFSNPHDALSEPHDNQSIIRCSPEHHNPIVSISNPISKPIESMQTAHCAIPDSELDELRKEFEAMGF